MRVELIDMTSDYIPLSLLYLKSYAEADALLSRQCEIEVIAPTNTADVEQTASEIAARRPNVVGFSCYIWNMLHNMKLCQRLKEIAPETVIVVGGPDVSSVPDKALRTYPWIDVVVRGEGEETFRSLLQHWVEQGGPSVEPDLAQIEGLGFRENGHIVLTDKRPFIEDLDVIPTPYLNGCLDLQTEERTILFETYRGCPFKCSFCFYPKDYGNLLHSFSLERVERDLTDILHSGIKSIFLMDPTFNIPPKRAKDILRVIARNRTSNDLSVTVELRVDLLDQEFMDLLIQAGISVVEIGLQSSSDAVLRAVDRKQSMRKITENVGYLQSIGVDVVFQLIYGMPEDSYECFLDSIDFCVSLDADKIESYRLQLLPGTPMYQNAEILGLNFIDEGAREIIDTRTMTKEEIDRAEHFSKLLECFYDDNVARETFRWLARHLGTTYARLLDDYLGWRLALDLPVDDWRAEGNRHIGSFVRSRGLEGEQQMLDTVENLLRFDFLTSPVIETPRNLVVRFDYDIEGLTKGQDGCEERRKTWLLFHKTNKESENFFNGRFLRKSYRRLPEGSLLGDAVPDSKMFDIAETTAIADWHLRQGDLESADTIVRAVLQNAPEQADALHILGVIMAERGELAPARSHVERAVAAEPTVGQFHVTLGNILCAEGKLDDAVPAYRMALERQPDSVEAHFNLGVIYAQLDALEDAIEAFRHVVALDPEMAEGHFSLAELLSASGAYEAAIPEYEWALTLEPDHEDARAGLAFANQQSAQSTTSSQWMSPSFG